MKFLIAALALATGAVSAQTLKGVKVDMATAQVGQAVTATVELEATGAPNCGLRVRWGDGAVTERKINSAAEVPFKTTHTYAKPGDYTITADPGRVGGSLGCIGKNATAMVKVSAPPAAAPAAGASAAGKTAAALPTCPEGWKLDAKSVNKKSGAYTCTAKAGTATPDKKPACPGDLTYFENSKKGQMGCRV
ncbi:MAG: hypothetical protein U1F00_18640 [Rhodoferax sp.]|jgi:hypothetical protein|nr:hypothetical protein [Rhodoferax sp.]